MRAEDNSQMTTLSPESYQTVMTAIKHAKLKGHCQVQPLHVAAALLDPSTRSPTLHKACLQSLEEPSHPLKCDALDLCFKVALDRLPVITDVEKNKDQAMSNALGAALKRAHANERRGTPEQNLTPLLAVKTGIAHLTISILDDPSVSRVFREAGFSSTAVKNIMEEAVAKAALAGPVALSTLDNSGLRRMHFPLTPLNPFNSAVPKFRSSFCSGPFSPEDPSMNHAKLLERGRMSGSNGMDVHVERESPYFATAAVKLLETHLDHKGPEQTPRMLGRPTFTHRHERDIRSIVNTFVPYPKKRNLVVVGDSGASSLLTELSQRLARGEFPSLRGVRFLDLPFTSLSVGILSQEAFEAKLAKLKSDVDGCMKTGGAIISVGGLQWLLDPSQNMAPRVLQELQQLMSSNAHNRLWVVASASFKAMEHCRANNHILLDSLGFHPFLLAPDSPAGAVFQSRPGSVYDIMNAEISVLSQRGASKLAPGQDGLEKPDCCPDCSSKFQQECSILVKEEQTLCLGSGQPPSCPLGFPKLCWMKVSSEKGRATLPVKEEENLVSLKIEELRRKWQQQCSARHAHFGCSKPVVSRDQSASPVAEIVSPHDTVLPSGGFMPVVSRDQSVSPVAEIVSPHERIPRMSLPILSGPVSFKWAPPQSQKVADEKSLEMAPLHARMARGSMPNFLSGSKPSSALTDGKSVTKSRVESDGSTLRKDPSNGPTLSMKSNIFGGKSGHPGASVGTDLALGRPNHGPLATRRDLREDGQQPRHNKLQQPKTLKMSAQLGLMRSDMENLNELCWSLSNAVSWQKEAVGGVAETVRKCRSGEGRKTGAHARTDSWFMFLGPDRVGKREVAKALAKLVFGREEQFILMTGWQTNASGRIPPSTGILAADSNGVKFRGKTPLDRLVEALLRKPFSVVLLENIECADSVLKKNLVKAMERGRLADTLGKEVSLANFIVIMTCGAGASMLSRRRSTGGRAVEFDEEKLSRLGPREVRLFVDDTSSVNLLEARANGLSIVDTIKTEQVLKQEKPAESILLFGSPMFKRKADSMAPNKDSRGSRSPPKRICKREECSPNRAFALDLNLAAEENLSEDEEPCIIDELCATSAPESVEELAAKVIDCARGQCPAEMFALADLSVIFKPFNLNALTDRVLEKLENAVHDVMQIVKVPVEIDRNLLEVMVSFAWENFSHPDKFQGWVDNVLMGAMSGLAEKSPLRPPAVMKVVSVERNSMMTTPGIADGGSTNLGLLPKRITVVQ